jgi:tripartite-type tricarboxylate transporter receptor subunit TctC
MHKRILLTTLSACLLHAGPAFAAYPDKPVTIVVPFPGGQTGDIIARTVGEQLAKKLGQPFIIENRPGAGGTLGTGYAARGTPDGYTLLLTSTGPFAIAPSLYSKLPYQPLEDFAAVADIAATPQVITTAAGSGMGSIKDLIDVAKKGDLSFASAGNGSTQHLTMEVFNKATGLKMTHIPFKGSAEAQTQVMSGLIPVSSDSLPAILSSIKAGKLRPLAVVDAERSPFLPDVPTLAEAGVPTVSTVAFFGLMAPKGTPAPIVDQLNTAVNEILQAPEVQERFKTLALTPAKQKSAADFAAHLASEVQKFKKVVDDAGAKID